jgi:hypothetical protein
VTLAAGWKAPRRGSYLGIGSGPSGLLSRLVPALEAQVGAFSAAPWNGGQAQRLFFRRDSCLTPRTEARRTA